MSCNARSALVFKTTPTFKICYKKNKTKTNVLVVPDVLLYLKQLPTLKVCNNKNKCLVALGVLWYLKQLLYSKFAKKSNASPKSKCYCPLYENIGDKVCPLFLHLLCPR